LPNAVGIPDGGKPLATLKTVYGASKLHPHDAFVEAAKIPASDGAQGKIQTRDPKFEV